MLALPLRATSPPMGGRSSAFLEAPEGTDDFDRRNVELLGRVERGEA